MPRNEANFGIALMTGDPNTGRRTLAVAWFRSLQSLCLTTDLTVTNPYMPPSAWRLRTQGLFHIAVAEAVVMPLGTVDPETGTPADSVRRTSWPRLLISPHTVARSDASRQESPT